MKFGRNLSRNQVPEWSDSYVDYKRLKKLVKSASEQTRNGNHADNQEFRDALDRTLGEVSGFYDRTLSKATSRLGVLHTRYGVSDDASVLDRDETEEFAGALLELRTQLRNLQWFGEINRRGFVKITKKYDKKVPGSSVQQQYIATKVDPMPFAKGDRIPPVLAEISKWLSALRNAQDLNNARADNSVSSLARFSARADLDLSSSVMEALDQAIREDDAPSLHRAFDAANLSGDAEQALLHHLLQRSVSAHAKTCILFTLKHIKEIKEPLDVNDRNCIHRLVIHIGRTKLTPASKLVTNGVVEPPGYQDRRRSTALGLVGAGDDIKVPYLDEHDPKVQVLIHLLEHLQPHHRVALLSKDYSGRLPLHYAAQYGFVLGCELIMTKMREWNLFSTAEGVSAIELQDYEGFAPFHLSAMGGHAPATEALLKDASSSDGGYVRLTNTGSESGIVLALATKSNSADVVQMLIKAGVDMNWTDRNGESALHIAARYGNDDSARILLDGDELQKSSVDIAEKLYGWTALHVAAVDGYINIVRLLLEAGADASKPDSSGWTAKEHAALRGHMEIADLLAPLTLEDQASAQREKQGSPPLNPADKTSVEAPRSNSMNNRTRSDEYVKSVGHPHLTDESLVLVSLGSLDVRKEVEAVSIDRAVLTESYATQLDAALSIVVAADGAQGDPATIDLPAQENIATEPVVFKTKDIAKVRLLFDLVPTYAGLDKNKFGRAVALLSSVKPSIGSRRMNLQGDLCVPIMSNSYDVIGTINFSFQVITPFQHPNMDLKSKSTYWKKFSSTMLIGHRGLGKNLTSNRSLQLGENTLPSFIAAANLGAQYVEFDVQLTKDHVPVIYHDFLVSETGIDAPVHTLTLEQFLHINPDSSRAGSPVSGSLAAQNGGGGQRPRSNSLKPNRSRSMGFAGDGSVLMNERMKHTRDFKEKGFKANSRGNFIQAPFATLEDLFVRLPEDIGFNIEMKYPMLQESEEHDMDAYAVELNSFCDTVLSKVYDLVGDRHIIFSSFNPDVCLCLSFKQPSIPILFLTDAGCSPVGDVRASSLQEAIRFASRWNLLGVVSAAQPLINSPRLVKVVKENGLVCVSYGSLNNDPALVQRQVKEGIDAVIVDSVLAIRKGLTSNGTPDTEQHNSTKKSPE